MRAGFKLTLRVGLALASALVVSVSHADEPSKADVAEADRLFEEGRTLMKAGSVTEACPKLERSFQLSPRLGTMLNLGACFEQSSRFARAMAIYERAATMAHDAGRPDREKAARDLAAALEPRLAKLLVLPEGNAPGLVVEIDDAPITPGGLVPIDPGDRRIAAHAPGKEPWSTTLHADAGATLRVKIPALHDQLAAPSPTVATPAPAPAPATRSNPLRPAGIAVGLGLAVVGAGLGTVFGLRAASLKSDADPYCDARGCDARGIARLDDAMTAGNIATGAFIGMGVGLAMAALAAFVVPPSKTASLTTITF